MNLFTATQNSLRKILDFKSRSRRSEFWGFVLTVVLSSFLLGFFDKLFFGASWPLQETITVYDSGLTTKNYSVTTIYGPISKTFFLIMLIPIVPASVRRLHDVGFTGFILFLPIIVGFLAGPRISSFVQGQGQGSFPVLPILLYLASCLLIVFLLFKDSGYSNRYGQSEKYPNKVLNPMLDEN